MKQYGIPQQATPCHIAAAGIEAAAAARAVALEAPRIEGTAVSSLVVLAAPGTTSVFECERSSSAAAQRRTSNMRA